jgi:hypothetical protein
LNWGQKYFGIHLNLGDMYFVEVEINKEAIRPGIKKVNRCNLTRGWERQGSKVALPFLCTFLTVSAPRSCTRDEGRPLGAGLQGQAPNRLKLLWSNARVVSVKEKAL